MILILKIYITLTLQKEQIHVLSNLFELWEKFDANKKTANYDGGF